jgi:DNA-binding GntR family transcriptional regulator
MSPTQPPEHAPLRGRSPSATARLAREQAEGAGGNLHAVYLRLRQDILDAVLPPGALLNQVHLARDYGVSRTPVREAMRMLEAEGLVDARFQRRMSVTHISAEEVDETYAMWIMLHALATSMTVPRMMPVELERLRSALEAMNRESPSRGGSPARWEPLHRAFHAQLTRAAGPVIGAAITHCWSRSERARRSYMRVDAAAWRRSDEEHAALATAYARRSIEDAVATMSRQLVRVALTVIAELSPGHKPRAIHEALGIVMGPEGPALIDELAPRHRVRSITPGRKDRG